MTWLDDIIKQIRQTLGDTVDLYGTTRNFSEGGWSELIAGGDTIFTVPTAQADEGTTDPGTGLYDLANTYDTGGGLVDNTSGTGTVTNDGETGDGGGVDFNSILEEQRKLAQSAYDEGVRRAGVGFDRARGIYDEGIGNLATRRGEFQDIYDVGSEDILGAYEGGRGNIQRAAQGAATRSANSLRALGLGGSAFVKSQGRQRQQGARVLGNLSTQRAANDRTNLQGFNTNQQFANTQESSLNRFLGDASEARTSAINQAGLIQSGDNAAITENMAGFLSQILQSQLALNASNAETGNYVSNPYAVNIADLSSTLNASVPTLDGGGGGNLATNVVSPTTLQDLLKIRGSGLYNA